MGGVPENNFTVKQPKLSLATSSYTSIVVFKYVLNKATCVKITGCVDSKQWYKIYH